jgi:hypothetical protein
MTTVPSAALVPVTPTFSTASGWLSRGSWPGTAA